MRDHGRLLGNLFLAWAAAQGVAAVVLAIGRENQGLVSGPVLFLVALAILVVAYGAVGWQLRRGDPRMRIPAIFLSALALLSFPVGTALGLYGLWAMLRRREVPAAR